LNEQARGLIRGERGAADSAKENKAVRKKKTPVGGKSQES